MSVSVDGLESMMGYPTRTGRKARNLPAPAVDGVSYSKAAAHLNTHVGMIVRLVSNGILANAPCLSRRRMVDPGILKQLTDKLADPRYISESEVLARLGETKAQLKRRWVITGLLRVRNLVLVRQYLVSKVDQILELKKHYSLTSDLSREAGMIRTHFINQVRIGRHPEPSRIGGTAAPLLLFAKQATRYR